MAAGGGTAMRAILFRHASHQMLERLVPAGAAFRDGDAAGQLATASGTPSKGPQRAKSMSELADRSIWMPPAFAILR